MSEKLQKILAQAGLGSRREIERWIAAGRVQVNNLTAKLGERVDTLAQVSIDGKPVHLSIQTSCQVLLYHKPVGEMCTRHDPQGRPTVFDHLPALTTTRWVMVGRLDYYTSGLLLFTDNGELANQLMHPRFHLKRVYLVRVYGSVNDTILTRLRQGVTLEDGLAQFDSIKAAGGEGKNHWYQVSISMGRNRIVRRLWESQGLQVNRLIRIGFGPLQLPRTLAAGEYRLLTQQEIATLQAL